MKIGLLIITCAVLLFISANVWASDVRTTVKQVDGNTIVYCSIDGTDGGITKATIMIYESDGHKISVIRGKMNLSADSEATYVLSGTHLEVAGKCKLFTSQRSEIPSANPGTAIYNGIANGNFYMSMK